jgi:hypothetical protein
MSSSYPAWPSSSVAPFHPSKKPAAAADKSGSAANHEYVEVKTVRASFPSFSSLSASTLYLTQTRQITLEWQITNLRQIFDGSRGDTKSKCLRSQVFGDGCWQVYFYPNVSALFLSLSSCTRLYRAQSGHEQYCSLYLSCEPTPEERERGPLGGGNGQQGWYRDGKFKFSFEVRLRYTMLRSLLSIANDDPPI